MPSLYFHKEYSSPKYWVGPNDAETDQGASNLYLLKLWEKVSKVRNIIKIDNSNFFIEKHI
jgi:hypothetical protein